MAKAKGSAGALVAAYCEMLAEAKVARLRLDLEETFTRLSRIQPNQTLKAMQIEAIEKNEQQAKIGIAKAINSMKG